MGLILSILRYFQPKIKKKLPLKSCIKKPYNFLENNIEKNNNRLDDNYYGYYCDLEYWDSIKD